MYSVLKLRAILFSINSSPMVFNWKIRVYHRRQQGGAQFKRSPAAKAARLVSVPWRN